MLSTLRRDLAAPHLLWSAVMLLSGCSESLLLGSECENERARCELTGPGGTSDAPDPTATPAANPPVIAIDGGLIGASIDASGAAPDALATPSADGGVEPILPLLALENGSFERGGGISGDVVLARVVSTIAPFSPVDIIFAELPSWYACIPFSISSLSHDPTGDPTLPALEGDYLSFVIDTTPVRQALGAPLTPGATYAVEANVMARTGGTPGLRLEVRGAAALCDAGTVLGRSAVIEDSEDWTRTCVTFTADEAHAYLLLAPSLDSETAPLDATFYLDELRQVASCEPSP